DGSTETAPVALWESVSAFPLKVRVSSMSKFRKESHRPKSIARKIAPSPSRSVSVETAREAETPEIRIGTSGWHYLPWQGSFYPEELKVKDFLSYYVGQFDTTEINNSFYRLPTEKAVRDWHDRTPDGFLFAWKISRLITLLKRLKDVEENVAFAFERMSGLEAKLGPVLIQLPPSFKAGPETRERVARCLSLIPAGHRAAVE